MSSPLTRYDRVPSPIGGNVRAGIYAKLREMSLSLKMKQTEALSCWTCTYLARTTKKPWPPLMVGSIMDI